MSFLSRVQGLMDRWGGMILAPRTTLDGILRGGPGGLVDLLILLGLKVLAVQLPQLVGALWFMVEVSYAAGISTFLNTIAESILVPILAVFVGTVVTGWMLRGRSGRQRNLDLIALCMTPPVCFELLSTMVLVLIGSPQLSWVVISILVIEVLWFVSLVAIVVKLVRTAAEESKDRGEEGRG